MQKERWFRLMAVFGVISNSNQRKVASPNGMPNIMMVAIFFRIG